MASEIESAKIAAQAAADLKSLELLFDYTKFHIGVYLTLAASYIAVATVKVGDKMLLEVNRTWLWIAVAAIAIAGLAGGVIASSITQCACQSTVEFLKQDIGPWSLRLWSAQTWTYIEHTFFWMGIIGALLSLRSPNRLKEVPMPSRWATMSLPERHDVIAADGSQTRVLLAMGGGSTVHCTLPSDAGSPPGVSFSTVNVGIDEIWYFLEGEGEIWRKNEEASETVAVRPGVCLTIPAGTIFQFRNTGREPLVFLCITMPPWRPGTNVKVDDCRWPVGAVAA